MSEKSDATVEMAETAEAKSLNPIDIDVKSDVKKKKPSLKYFLELLSDSVVTGIPQIVTVGNLVRKVFKILVLTACLAGFIYQAVEFMNIYNTYPSSLEIEVKYRDELPPPSVTICNRNPVQRKQFCKEKTELCAKPTNLTRFCNMYPHHCNENTTVNDLEFVISNAYIAVEDLEIYGQNVDDLLAECCFSFFALADECRKNSVKFEHSDENNMIRHCYTIHFDKVFNLQESTRSFKELYEEGVDKCLWWSPMALESTYSVMVNLDPEEVFRPEMKPSAQVLVHSSNDLKNPFQKGFTIEEGKQYTVTMRAIEEELLPAPYSTNCTKNEEMPENYDRQACIDECSIKLFAERCGCTPISLIANDIPTCPDEEIADCLSSIVEGETCFLQCPRLCHSFSFVYEVTSSDFPDSIRAIDLGDGPVFKDSIDKNTTKDVKEWSKLDNKKGKAFLKAVYSKKEITIYKYKPKYESVEILGYIGGFSGIWLGVSLVAVFDFFETIIVFICYLVKRAKAKKNYSGS